MTCSYGRYKVLPYFDVVPVVSVFSAISENLHTSYNEWQEIPFVCHRT